MAQNVKKEGFRRQSKAARKKKAAQPAKAGARQVRQTETERLYAEYIRNNPTPHGEAEAYTFGRGYTGAAEDTAARLRDRGAARKRRARRNNRVTVSVVIILLVGLWLLFAVGFKISDITYSGSSVYDQSVLQTEFGYKVGEHLFSFRASHVEQKMLEALPYLDTVKITRLLPGSVHIEVTPSVETYYICQDLENFVTTKSFKILRTGDNASALLQLKGLQLENARAGETVVFADAQQQSSLQIVLQALEQCPVAGLTEIDCTDPYNMELRCDTGICIAVGTYTGMEYKLQLAVEAIARLPENSAGLMDVSNACTGHKAYFTASAAGTG